MLSDPIFALVLGVTTGVLVQLISDSLIRWIHNKEDKR